MTGFVQAVVLILLLAGVIPVVAFFVVKFSVYAYQCGKDAADRRRRRTRVTREESE